MTIWRAGCLHVFYERNFSYKELQLFKKLKVFPSSPLSATWALTTQRPCSISGTALSTRWTDPYFSQMPSTLQSGYTMCPCLKRPKPCLMWVLPEWLYWGHSDCKVLNDITFSLSVLGAELQCTHPYSATRVTLHLLPPLPASPTLHSHRQQYPAHHKCIKVSPAGPGLHGLPGGKLQTHS